MRGRLLLPALTGLALAVGAGCASKSQQGDGGQAGTGTGAAGTAGTGSGGGGQAGTGGERERPEPPGALGPVEPAGAEARPAARPAPAVATSVSPTPSARRALLLAALFRAAVRPRQRRLPPLHAAYASRARCLSRGGRHRLLRFGRQVHGDVRRALHSVLSQLLRRGGARCKSTNAATTFALATPIAPQVRGVCTVGYPRACLYGVCRATRTAPRDRRAAASWPSWGDPTASARQSSAATHRSLRQQRRLPRTRARIRSSLRT